MPDYTIRTATVADAGELLEIYRWYVENTAVSFEHAAPTVEEFAARIRYYRRRYPYLCLMDGEEVVGFAFAHAFRERAAYDYSAETTIYLRHDRRHEGCGTHLYNALIGELSRMGITNVYACIAQPEGEDPYLTPASPRFHEKLGFTVCGTFHNCGRKFGRWYTMIWMEKIIGEFRDDPAPLTPYPALTGERIEEDDAVLGVLGITEH